MSETQKEQAEPKLSKEDELKTLLYRFVTLYDRWREDRQIAAKKDAEMAELAERFTKEIEGFEREFAELSKKTRQDLVGAFKDVLKDTHNKAIKEVKEEARAVIDAVVKSLNNTVKSTEQVLSASQQVVSEQSGGKMFIMWLTAIFVGILFGITVIKWFMPAPALPLTDKQILELNNGRILHLAWPKMTKQEKDRIGKLADEAAAEQTNNQNNNEE